MNLDSMEKAIAEAVKQGTPIIGFLMQWSVPRDTVVDRDELQANLTNNGMSLDLSDAILPKKVSEKKSFRRAIQQINRKKKQSDGSTKEMKRLKVEVGTKGVACYGLVHLDPDRAAREFDINNCGWVAFDSGGKAGIKSNDPELKKRVELLMSQKLTSYDIREMLSRWARVRNGFSTRPNGGSYFVPTTPEATEEIDIMREAIDYVTNGVHGYLTVFPILGGAGTQGNLQQSFTSSMLTDIEKYKADVDKFFSDPRKKQKNSSLRRLEDISELRRFAMSYEAILDGELLLVQEQIDELQTYTQGLVADAIATSVDDDDDDDDDEVDEVEETEEPTEEEVAKFLAESDDEGDDETETK